MWQHGGGDDRVRTGDGRQPDRGNCWGRGARPPGRARGGARPSSSLGAFFFRVCVYFRQSVADGACRPDGRCRARQQRRERLGVRGSGGTPVPPVRRAPRRGPPPRRPGRSRPPAHPHPMRTAVGGSDQRHRRTRAVGPQRRRAMGGGGGSPARGKQGREGRRQTRRPARESGVSEPLRTTKK